MTTIGLSYSLVKISTKCAPALRRAVGELFTIGWLVTEYRKDMWEIRRPRNRSLE